MAVGVSRPQVLCPDCLRRRVPAAVRRVLGTLEDAGWQAYLVGGCVRDLLRDVGPKDWDVATDARPEAVMALFPRVRPTGIAHGTVTVLTRGGPVEVTTFRVEEAYTDHRHPDAVRFVAEIEADLSRRDFTINAMALDSGGRLVDPFGGLEDLLIHRRVRAVGDPESRFREDALRLLRAVRFAAELDLEIDPQTLAAVGPNASLLTHVSAERVRDEFSRIVTSRAPGRALEVMRQTDLLAQFLPELLEGVGVEQNIHHRYDVWTHALLSVANTPPRLELRLAALLHDVAKPRCLVVENGERHFYHHEVVGAHLTRSVLRRLRYPTAVIDRVVHLVRRHMDLHHQRDMSDAAVRRLVRRIGLEHLDDLLVLRRADRIASGNKPGAVSRGTRRLLERIDRVLAEDAAFGLKDLAVDGHDVMRVAGIGPGPAVGRILNALLEAVLDDPGLNTRPALEDLVRQYARALERGEALPRPAPEPAEAAESATAAAGPDPGREGRDDHA